MSGSQLRPWISVAYLQLRNIMQRLPSFAIFLVFCAFVLHAADAFVDDVYGRYRERHHVDVVQSHFFVTA